MNRLRDFDWTFSATAEAATGVLLIAAFAIVLIL